MKLSIQTFAILSAFIGVAVAAPGRRQTCTTPNPVSLTVPAGSSMEVTADSHAAFIQQLTISPGVPGFSQVVFQGSGENVAMPIVSGGTGDSMSIPAQNNAYQVILVFAFSSNGGSTFTVPTILCPIVTDDGIITISVVSSEDSTDSDDNDTTVQVVFVG